jgi:hypothetical protein
MLFTEMLNSQNKKIDALKIQHSIAVRGVYVLENPLERQNCDVRSSDLMGKTGLGEPNIHEM